VLPRGEASHVLPSQTVNGVTWFSSAAALSLHLRDVVLVWQPNALLQWAVGLHGAGSQQLQPFTEIPWGQPDSDWHTPLLSLPFAAGTTYHFSLSAADEGSFASATSLAFALDASPPALSALYLTKNGQVAATDFAHQGDVVCLHAVCRDGESGVESVALHDAAAAPSAPTLASAVPDATGSLLACFAMTTATSTTNRYRVTALSRSRAAGTTEVSLVVNPQPPQPGSCWFSVDRASKPAACFSSGSQAVVLQWSPFASSGNAPAEYFFCLTRQPVPAGTAPSLGSGQFGCSWQSAGLRLAANVVLPNAAEGDAVSAAVCVRAAVLNQTSCTEWATLPVVLQPALAGRVVAGRTSVGNGVTAPFFTDGSRFEGSWEPFASPLPVAYRVGVASKSQGVQTLALQDAGSALSLSKSGLWLEQGQEYALVVHGTDCAGELLCFLALRRQLAPSLMLTPCCVCVAMPQAA
jgi:hypothetical protein